MTLFQDNGVLGDCWDLEKVNIEKGEGDLSNREF